MSRGCFSLLAMENITTNSITHKQVMIHFITRNYNPNKQLAERQRLHALTISQVFAEYQFAK